MNESIEFNLERIMNIGIALSAEKNMNKLLDTIITEAMAITNCDAGTLYLMEGGKLHFKIMRNHTLKSYQGGDDSPVTLPPVEIKETHVASYVVIHRSMENIEDVYNSSKFDFSGPKNYDKITGYRTKSMLVVPLENNKAEIVGVLQLINAKDLNGNIIPFDKSLEGIFRSISSQAAIAVSNMRYMKENKELLQSVVEVFAATIDERSPYNANHTKNVAELVKGFVEFINSEYHNKNCSIYFDEEQKEQILIAAWLHDIGKIITPLEIMDKSTRLGANLNLVDLRFDTIYAAEELNYMKKNITYEQWKEISEEILSLREICFKANSGSPTSDEDISKINSMTSRFTIMPDGKKLYWLEPYEAESLAIKYGTLTKNERKIMEDHVSITKRLLDKIKFSDNYKDVATYASGHHEKLNGSGYPLGLSEEVIPIGTRILTVMDVFEALTAKDRPYKKTMPIEQAFQILDKMTLDKEVDADLVKLLKQWKLPNNI